MKKILFISLASMSLIGCQKYKDKEVYANVPVYMDYSAFRESFSFEKDVAINGAGNIFVYNQYIFLSEEDKGIHVIDNTNPANPIPTGFMNIPGNTQMAVKGTYLYANSYIDLLVINISDMNNPDEVNRLRDVFEYSTPAINDKYPCANVYKDKGVVVGWNVEKTKDVIGFGSKLFVADCPECEQTEITTKSASSMPTVLSGSLSKFAIDENFLYVIDNNDMIAFDITEGLLPDETSNQPTWRESESLFSKDGYLYMGTTTGMVIYNAKNMPSQPEEEGSIEHVESCDPVIVAGEYAYLTLHSGSECGGIEDQFQVIDISNKQWPIIKKRYDMTSPHGLSFDNNLLFICDGTDGLKVYDASDPIQSGNNLLYHFTDITANDIILNNGNAVLIADHGIYQYNYSNPASLQLISILNF